MLKEAGFQPLRAELKGSRVEGSGLWVFRVFRLVFLGCTGVGHFFRSRAMFQAFEDKPLLGKGQGWPELLHFETEFCIAILVERWYR